MVQGPEGLRGIQGPVGDPVSFVTVWCAPVPGEGHVQQFHFSMYQNAKSIVQNAVNIAIMSTDLSQTGNHGVTSAKSTAKSCG